MLLLQHVRCSEVRGAMGGALDPLMKGPFGEDKKHLKNGGASASNRQTLVTQTCKRGAEKVGMQRAGGPQLRPPKGPKGPKVAATASRHCLAVQGAGRRKRGTLEAR